MIRIFYRLDLRPWPSKLAMSEYVKFSNDEDFLLDSVRAVNNILGETNHSVCDSLKFVRRLSFKIFDV